MKTVLLLGFREGEAIAGTWKWKPMSCWVHLHSRKSCGTVVTEGHRTAWLPRITGNTAGFWSTLSSTKPWGWGFLLDFVSHIFLSPMMKTQAVSNQLQAETHPPYPLQLWQALWGWGTPGAGQWKHPIPALMWEAYPLLGVGCQLPGLLWRSRLAGPTSLLLHARPTQEKDFNEDFSFKARKGCLICFEWTSHLPTTCCLMRTPIWGDQELRRKINQSCFLFFKYTCTHTWGWAQSVVNVSTCLAEAC